MKKKTHVHACNLGSAEIRKKSHVGKKVSPLHNKNVDSKALASIYNKYYKDQVSALYRAVR
ncbi:MAG: hypothetical protein P9L88_04420 [Candidatus Tantalella remota]|nr:hypothetical protein [Candidatus Tantalella remota]